ncbi:Ger(x)C family spore germination protein [Thalassobacillus hwangdonensis]|uniref:Ger(X)C family spore germination protein n=1 Tax=Thalassobacillus hwangdonensis TaxID=546108 RepID=A0ABW3L4H2_9BACI
MKAKLLFVLFIALAGCIPNESLEDVALVELVGYDPAEEDEIRGTIAIRQFGSEETKLVNEKYLSATEGTIEEIHRQIESKSSKPLRIGKLTMVFYNKALAEKGLTDSLDFIAREPKIGRDVHVAIVDGSTSELMQGQYSETESTGQYLLGMIKQNTQQYLPKSNLQIFLYAHYAKGKDPVLPIFRMDGKEAIISGFALLREGKMISSLTVDQTFIYKMLSERIDKGVRGIDFQGREIVMDELISNVKYELAGSNDNPMYTLNIKIKGMISETSTLDQTNRQETTTEMEEAFEDHFKYEGEKLIKDFQELRIDPLGLGEVLNNRRRKVDMNRWKQMYPDVPVKVNVEVSILGIGITG